MQHWPELYSFPDVREIDETAPYVDILAGGFPCQAVSVAGKRLGEKDERWLWPEFIRIINAILPKWVIIENVPGLYVRGLQTILQDLAQSGYDAEWDCFSAADFGARHLRERIVIVAYPNRKGLSRTTNIERQAFVAEAIERCRISSRRFWEIEPGISRVVVRVPYRVDRIKALGDSVVPQMFEWIGESLVLREKARR